MDENYISLERAIERMYEVTEECGTERIFIDRIIDELENLPSSPNICIHPQWIPVSERLPDDFISVIIYIPSESPLPMVKEAYRAEGSWAAKMQIFFDEEVTHWMPLPEPPKEDL